MTLSEHLQFLALMIPTVVLLVLAAVSLADPEAGAHTTSAPPAVVYTQAPAAVDEAGQQTAY